MGRCRCLPQHDQRHSVSSGNADRNTHDPGRQQFHQNPNSTLINFLQVPQGFDVADDAIVLRSNQRDLVITADIPLAADLIAKGVQALDPRGELYTEDNVRVRVNMRDFMDTMRSSGVQSGGPAPIRQADKQAFANALDRILTQQKPA
ncbi:MAG: DUF188 domain-containing protein [Pseudomonadales bacterium]|nr:DUF188 domain-containing protein [Pseudomonadales bacterium]